MKVAASPHSFLIPLFSLLPLEGGAPKGGGWLSKRDEVVGSTVFPVIPLLTSFLDRKRKRFLAFARNDDAGRRHTPSVLWKEVPRRGGGWLSKRYFHTRGCQPRLASLVCSFQRKGRE